MFLSLIRQSLCAADSLCSSDGGNTVALSPSLYLIRNHDLDSVKLPSTSREPCNFKLKFFKLK